MKYNSITKFEEFSENPFIEKAIEDIKIIKKQQVIRATDKNEIQMIVSQSGEVQGHTAFMRFVEVEEEKFAKLYLSQFSAFWELSKPAIRVFGYILTKLEPKKDYFLFDMDSCLKHTKYTHRNSIMSGISILIESNIIARSDKHYIYFINPMVVFNGDRVTFAKTYIKKRTEKLSEKNVNNVLQIDLFEEESIEKQMQKFEQEFSKNDYIS